MMHQFLIVLVCATVALAIPDNRINNGKEAKPGQFPYAVYVQPYYDSIGKYGLCGGSLISLKYVLTAAHCFEYGSTGTVRLGSIYMYHGGQLIPFSNVTKHEKYKRRANNQGHLLELKNDIALIPLDEIPIVDGFNVSIIPMYFGALPISTPIKVAGFGLLNDTIFTDSLWYATVKLTHSYNCLLFDPKNMICMEPGDNGQATCKGDSGSGGTANIPGNIPHLVSIVSNGPNCTDNANEMHVNIARYEAWILSKL